MKVRCYQITPSEYSGYDYTIVVAGKTWEPAIEAIDRVLDIQYVNQDDPDNLDWENIKAEIKCVWVEEDELLGLGYSREDFADCIDEN